MMYEISLKAVTTNFSSFNVCLINRSDTHCGAGGSELPDHRGDEGGDEETQQLVHGAEEVQQLCLLEEEEEEVVLACKANSLLLS